MKKILLGLICLCYLFGGISYGACSCGGSHSGSHGCSHSSSHGGGGGSSHDTVRLINTEYQKSEHKFPNCDKHYIVTETTTNIYSDGSRRTYSNSTIYNTDGTVIETDCRSVEHLIYDGKHYFIIYKNGYKLINSSGEVLTRRNYARMTKIDSNRILVKFENRYGIIDLNEKTIVPIKYQKMTPLTKDGIFLTKLNGYYGIIDKDDNVLLKNNCERIKQVHDVLIIKKYGKYGIYSLEGKVILEPVYDKIKKFKEYILVKNNDKYGVLDFYGNKITDTKYKKIKLERNVLQGLLYDDNWEDIPNNYERTF